MPPISIEMKMYTKQMLNYITYIYFSFSSMGHVDVDV